MQSLITTLGSFCLCVLAALLLGLTQCRSDGCMGVSFLIFVVWIAALAVFIVGLAIWRADRDVTEIRKPFKTVVSLLGGAVLLGGLLLLVVLGA